MSSSRINKISNEIILLTREEIENIFGYCKETVNKMFRDKEFPAITFGKTYLVELDALKKYISTRRG